MKLYYLTFALNILGQIGFYSTQAFGVPLKESNFLIPTDETRIGIFIGNNIGLADEKPLKFAARDAALVKDVLVELGDLDKGNSKVFVNANKKIIVTALTQMTAQVLKLRQTGKPVQLIMYYSGHGGKDGLHMQGEVLELKQLKTIFEQIDATLKILIVDACYSGSLLESKGGRVLATDELRIEDEQDLNGSIMLASSSAGELSHESASIGGSLFTHYFVSALRGASDTDNDQQVTLWEMFNYIKTNLNHISSAKQITSQTPTFNVNLKGSETLILTKLNQAKARLKIQNLGKVPIHIVDQRRAVSILQFRPNSQKEVTFSLPPSLYWLYKVEQGKSSLARIDLEKQEEVIVKASDFIQIKGYSTNAKGLTLDRYLEEEVGNQYFNPIEMGMRFRMLSDFPNREGWVIPLNLFLSHKSFQSQWILDLLYVPNHISPKKISQQALGIGLENTWKLGALFKNHASLGAKIDWWYLEQKLAAASLGNGYMMGSYVVLRNNYELISPLLLSVAVAPGILYYSGLNQDMKLKVNLNFDIAMSWGF